MADSLNMTIRVKTDELDATANDVEDKIKLLEQAFSDMEQVIRASYTYWEGDGNISYIESYKRKEETAATIFRRFRENVTDLRTIAGIYEENESNETEKNERLSANLID